MWIWKIPTGELFLEGTPEPAAVGYSGFGVSVNKPNATHISEMGPIPVGYYEIKAPIDLPKLGPFAMRLEPDPANTMFGRAGFLIHGAHIHDAQDSSHGCIILPLKVREGIWQSGDRVLRVVVDWPEAVTA